MAIWNAHERRANVRTSPRALIELAARLEADADAAWEWIERLQSVHLAADRSAPAERGVVPTPPGLAARMAAALLDAAPRGACWKVLDAGCGRGRLLTAVARAAAERGVRVDCEGIEIDPATARWAQALEPLARTRARGAVRSWRVRRADFLLSPSPSADCDAVIANPPYVPLRALDATARARLHGRTSAGGSGDLAALFVARLLDRVRPGGRLVVIVPNKLAASGYAAVLRRRLLEETCLEEIWDLAAARVFADHDTYPMVLVARREAAPPAALVRVRDASGTERAMWRLEDWAAMPDAVFPVAMAPELVPFVRKLLVLPRLGDQVEVACGIATSGYARGIGTGPARILLAGDVRALAVGRGRAFSPQQAGVGAATRRRLAVEKVVIPGMFKRLCAAWDAGGAQLGRVYAIAVAPDDAARRALVLALLNSRLYALLYAGLFGGVAQSGGWLRLNAPHLRALPWPDRPPTPSLVARVARLERGSQEWAALDREVECLFGLEPAESRVLERLARNLPSRAAIPHDRAPRRPRARSAWSRKSR